MAYPIKAIPKKILAIVLCAQYSKGRTLIINRTLQVVPERAEGPKALSPGQRPGYTSNQQCALKGQKL